MTHPCMAYATSRPCLLLDADLVLAMRSHDQYSPIFTNIHQYSSSDYSIFNFTAPETYQARVFAAGVTLRVTAATDPLGLVEEYGNL